jgi:peroxiredoxin
MIEMTIEEKLDLNKMIRKYNGQNTFILSLQTQLKSSKVKKIEMSGKNFKILSDKQYEVAKTLL